MPEVLDRLTAADYSARDNASEIREIFLSEIEPDPEQPRELFEEMEIGELALSMSRYGLINPVAVRRLDDADFGHYRIVAGERRYRAAKTLGWDKIKCSVLHCDPADAGLIALAENLIRVDLSPMEAARAIQRELDRHPTLTESALAHKVNKSQPWINDKRRLLNLSPDAQRALARREISESHGGALASLAKYPAESGALLERIKSEGLTTKATEEAVRQIKLRLEQAEREREAHSALPFGEEQPAPSVSASESSPPATAPTAAITDADIAESDVIDEDAPAEAESDDEVILDADAPEESKPIAPVAEFVGIEDDNGIIQPPSQTAGETNWPLPSTASPAPTLPAATPAPRPAAASAPTTTPPSPSAPAPSAADGTMVLLSNEWDDWLFEQDMTFDAALSLLKKFLPTPMTQKLVRVLNDDWREINPAQELMNESQAIEFFLTLLAKTKGIDLGTVRGLPL